MNKKAKGNMGILLLLGVGIALFFLFKGTPEQIIQQDKGTLNLALTDAPSDLKNAFVTINEISFYSSDKYDLIGEFKVDLMNLVDNEIDLGNVNIPEGNYKFVELKVSEARIVLIDGAEKTLKIPSQRIKIIGDFQIIKGETTRLVLDFKLDESLDMNRNVLKPVIIQKKIIQNPKICEQIEEKKEVIATDNDKIGTISIKGDLTQTDVLKERFKIGVDEDIKEVIKERIVHQEPPEIKEVDEPYCCGYFNELSSEMEYFWSDDGKCGVRQGLSCTGSCPTIRENNLCGKDSKVRLIKSRPEIIKCYILKCSSNADCETGQFCFKKGVSSKGYCISKPSVCTKLYKPVCGSDGKTYGNFCELLSEGVGFTRKGECRNVQT